MIKAFIHVIMELLHICAINFYHAIVTIRWYLYCFVVTMAAAGCSGTSDSNKKSDPMARLAELRLRRVRE